jgi:hypothetical protein
MRCERLGVEGDSDSRQNCSLDASVSKEHHIRRYRVGAQFAEDNMRILRRKKQSSTAKTKLRLPELGPRLVKDCKKHISDRADRERLLIFNRSKKAWRYAAILKAIEDGEIQQYQVQKWPRNG